MTDEAQPDIALACPSCFDADGLRTIEKLYAFSGVTVFKEKDCEWSGDTDVLWETSETKGINCAYCGWEYEGGDWREFLVPEADEETFDD